MKRRLMLVGATVLLSMLGLAAALHGPWPVGQDRLALVQPVLAQGPGGSEGDVGAQATLGAGFTYQGPAYAGRQPGQRHVQLSSSVCGTPHPAAARWAPPKPSPARR